MKIKESSLSSAAPLHTYIRHLLYIFHFHLGMDPSLLSVMKIVRNFIIAIQLVLKYYYL